MTKQLLIFIAALFLSVTSASVVIAQTCTSTISDMNFGTVNLQAGGAIDTTAVLSVTCSSSLNLQLLMRVCPNLNAGSGGSSGSTRLMTNGANTLSYQFFQDANRTVLWGSSTNTTLGSVPAIDVIAPILGPGTATRTIYGRILASQASKLAGTYLSMFSGGQARINYVRYLLGAPDCSTVADNPIQPSFNVQAIVNRSCTVSASPLNFGTHSAMTSNIDANGALTINCTLGLPYSISLNGGLSNAQPTQRRMTLGSTAIIYGLYSNSTRTVPWGNTAGQIVSRTGTGATESVPVYGRVAPQATPTSGVYTDTVVVTINY
ncbi:Csu type fimbrial protein [Ochrobactrum quorumnocens]|jgi:spore coat protein U-like protein|uniref:Spore coat protein U domain-containing protein n=1 Tax=Ochrobactrum quorumnocens TaxID=271865 RepID=A0A5N1K267_9HYPH|nr:spore coat protein U domain-containing protein [[Ochrobactrum] quorumnocens]KAA9370243.1 spore coat protein U domain-containing protein [[Ochrobactrum] quorumnocens]MBD7989283.1 spore coat U domain-containing protein [Ochrobactrum gallinarum]